ncbi:MAG TPA: ABC transporter permease [bacterium]|nr:ABC transporter permease [bacterium]
MSRYMLRKLLWAVPVLVVATTCAFLVLHLIPGDPVNLMLSGRPASDTVRANLRAKLGLNRPLPAQYVYFVVHALHGDFGQSFATGQPVSQVIAQQLPASLQLAGAGLVVGIGGGLFLGLVAGLYPNTAVDAAAMFVALVGISMPGYWTAMLLIYFFGLRLGWVPIVGSGLPVLILPAIVFGSYAIGNLARLVRSSILDVRGEDYIRTARAKGLLERTVVLRHALRNALFPVVTMMGLLLGLFVGGGVITETVFARQGIGALLVTSILTKDYPVVQAVLLLTTAAYVLSNVLVDVLYGVIDPRVRFG